MLTQSPLNKGPDFEEGPHSQIGEDEFFDAVENALDKLEEEQQYRDQLKMVSVDNKEDVDDVEEATKAHLLWPTIDEVRRVPPVDPGLDLFIHRLTDGLSLPCVFYVGHERAVVLRPFIAWK